MAFTPLASPPVSARREAFPWLLAAALGLAALSPLSAEAQATFRCEAGCAVVVVGAGLFALGTATIDVIQLVEGFDKYRYGHGMYTGGAILEIVNGSLQLAGGIALLAAGFVAMAGGSSSAAEGILAFGVPLTLLSAYILGHGIWSLTDGRPPEGSTVQVSAAPTEGGALAQIRGTF